MSRGQPCSRMYDRLPFRIGPLLPAGRVSVEDVPGVDDAREPGQDGQEDVDPEVNLEAAVKEDGEGWDEDGEDEEDDVGSSETSLGNGRSGGYRLLVGIGACGGRTAAGWCCAGSGGSTGRGVGLMVCCASGVVRLGCHRYASASGGSGRGNMVGLLRRCVGDRGRCRICL